MLDVDPEDRCVTIRPPGWCEECGPRPAARRTSVIEGGLSVESGLSVEGGLSVESGLSIDIVKFDAA